LIGGGFGPFIFMTEIIKKPIGRRPKQPPKDAAERIRTAAATGASQKGIATALGCAHDTLRRWLDERPDLLAAFDEGREKERKTLHNVLFEAATGGQGRDSLIAAMFLLKARHGYIEGEQPQQGNRVQINFALPGAKPLETVEVIDADAKPLPAITAGTARRS